MAVGCWLLALWLSEPQTVAGRTAVFRLWITSGIRGAVHLPPPDNSAEAPSHWLGLAPRTAEARDAGLEFGLINHGNLVGDWWAPDAPQTRAVQDLAAWLGYDLLLPGPDELRSAPPPAAAPQSAPVHLLRRDGLTGAIITLHAIPRASTPYYRGQIGLALAALAEADPELVLVFSSGLGRYTLNQVLAPFADQITALVTSGDPRPALDTSLGPIHALRCEEEPGAVLELICRYDTVSRQLAGLDSRRWRTVLDTHPLDTLPPAQQAALTDLTAEALEPLAPPFHELSWDRLRAQLAAWAADAYQVPIAWCFAPGAARRPAPAPHNRAALRQLLPRALPVWRAQLTAAELRVLLTAGTVGPAAMRPGLYQQGARTPQLGRLRVGAGLIRHAHQRNPVILVGDYRLAAGPSGAMFSALLAQPTARLSPVRDDFRPVLADRWRLPANGKE
ncbi:MAG: hypothetical protein K9N49_04470 [Candidatus Marinimicrobia bacterium]|nr:hypothetical protein [Candidatus Neomarinimicrobiota bacterium]